MQTPGKIETSCQYCQKAFYRWRHDIGRKFCCKYCANKFKTKTTYVDCDQCGKNFKKVETRSKRSFCSTDCYKTFNVDKNASRYKGGSVNRYGYKVIYVNKKRILEHVHFMQCAIGRKLKRHEQVHHINENKLDNRMENLFLTNSSEHRNKFHKLKQWSRKYKSCRMCNETSRKHEASGYCQRCYQRIRHDGWEDKYTPETPESYHESKIQGQVESS